jgi:hypothetical protein
MTRKSLLSGLLAVLAAVLIFTGCDNDTTTPPVETFTNVSADYPLTTGQGGLALTRAEKSNTTGIIYLTVSGTVSAADTSVAGWTGIWGAQENVTGKFSTVSIDFKGVFTAANVAKILAIRSENQALRYYTDAATGLLASAPTVARDSALNTTWIPSNPSQLPIRWKAYAASTIPANDNMTILIWDGASPKTVKLEVTSWAKFTGEVAEEKTGDIATIVLDYSGVTIQ